ncbi:sulfotransferase domain protein [bacterium BMS3Bbin04]|nr:sulfotransferase domain protein [bacterium BMS3Bbin04]
MSDFKIDFCGVGAAKAGTTWVYRLLSEHPQTCLGKRKELNYFLRKHPLEDFVVRTGSHLDSENYVQGPQWYEEQFSHRQPDQLKGELSPAYLGDPISPKLLHEHNPDMRIIINIRNPVDALYSLYFQIYEMHTINESFEEILERTTFGQSYYKYPVAIKRYLDVFPEEQILFIYLDDVKDDAKGVYSRLCKHLKIDEIELESLTKKANPSKMVRSRRIRNALLQIYILFDKNETMRGIRNWMRKKKLTRYAMKIRKWNSVKAKYPPMMPETRAKLIEFYRDDIIELGKIHNRDLSHWLEMPEPRRVKAT